MAARRIVIANQKGGCGKTVTTVNLAATLGEMGKKVLIVDMDPMRTASKNYGFLDREGGSPHLVDVLLGRATMADIVQNTDAPGVQIVQSTRQLSALEAHLKAQDNAVPQFVLKDALDSLPDNWDYILVDTHPDLDLLTVVPLTACEEILVAVQPSNNDIEGMPEFLETVSLIKQRLNPALRVTGVVLCRVVKRTTDCNDNVEILKKHFNGAVLPTMIRETVVLRRCAGFRKPVTLFDPKSSGAEDYRALAAEVEKRGVS